MSTTSEWGEETLKYGDEIRYRLMPDPKFTVVDVITCDQHDPYGQVHFMYMVKVGDDDYDFLCGRDVRKVK